MGRFIFLLLGMTCLLWGATGKDPTVLEDEPPAPSILEGKLMRHPEGLLKVALRTDGGQRCLLRESKHVQGELRLRDIPTGTRVRVEGRLDSYYFESDKIGDPGAALNTWIIYMDVKRIKCLSKAVPPGLPMEPLPKEGASENQT